MKRDVFPVMLKSWLKKISLVSYPECRPKLNTERRSFSRKFMSCFSHLQVHFATQAVLDKLPQRAPPSQLSGSLFLQLTVDQLGVCIPLYNGNQVWIRGDFIVSQSRGISNSNKRFCSS